MIAQEHIDLIHQSIDGSLSPDQEQRLHALLRSNSEARSEFERLSSVGESLALIDDVEPPPGLERSIMTAVRTARPSGQPHRGWFRSLIGAFSGMGQLQHGFTFAAGLAAGLLLFAVIRPGGIPGQSSLDPSQVSGTILRGPVVADERPASAHEVKVGNLSGWVSTEVGWEVSRIRMRIDSPAFAEITLRYSAELGSLAGIMAPPVHPSGVSLVPGTVTIRHEGAGDYTFDFVRSEGSAFAVAMRWESEGRSHEEVINLNPAVRR